MDSTARKKYVKYYLWGIILLALMLLMGILECDWGRKESDNSLLEAFHILQVDGWKQIEDKGNVAVWQKKGAGLEAENIVYAPANLSRVVCRGYMVKEEKPDLWKIIYNGFDSSGSIHFKLFSLKEDLSSTEKTKVMGKIKEIIALNPNLAGLTARKEEVFRKQLRPFLQKEGESMVVDPSKLIILKGIDYLPPLKIETSSINSIINIKVQKLE